RANADQRSIADGAAMQHDLVPHRDVRAHRERNAEVRMQHARILDVAAAPDADDLGVAAHHHAKPHTGVLCQFHVANYLRAVGHPGRVGQPWRDAVQFINRHINSNHADESGIVGMAPALELRQAALAALCLQDPDEKVASALTLYKKSASFYIAEHVGAKTNADSFGPEFPGRPLRPALIHPAQVPRRSSASMAGRAALVHAICHIEFNAINLALRRHAMRVLPRLAARGRRRGASLLAVAHASAKPATPGPAVRLRRLPGT